MSIALGDERVAAGVAYAQTLDPVRALRVATEFVNAYVLVRGKEIAIFDTGLPDYADKFAEAVNETGLGWDEYKSSASMLTKDRTNSSQWLSL